jgi:hypothetical protein
LRFAFGLRIGAFGLRDVSYFGCVCVCACSRREAALRAKHDKVVAERDALEVRADR